METPDAAVDSLARAFFAAGALERRDARLFLELCNQSRREEANGHHNRIPGPTDTRNCPDATRCAWRWRPFKRF